MAHGGTARAPHLWQGTFHYVYTVRAKLAVAGDFLSAIGWERRVESVERDQRTDKYSKAENGTLKEHFEKVSRLMTTVESERRAHCHWSGVPARIRSVRARAPSL